MGLPLPGQYRQILNTDAARYGGGGAGIVEFITAEQQPWHNQPLSAALTLPPLSTLWLEAPHSAE